MFHYENILELCVILILTEQCGVLLINTIFFYYGNILHELVNESKMISWTFFRLSLALLALVFMYIG